jgi:hypothetical protein
MFGRTHKPTTAIRDLIGTVVLLLVSISPLHAVNPDQACGAGSQRQRKEAGLRATATEILRIIKSKDGSAFLRYVDKDGMAVWGGILPPREIKREFRQKEGLYCLIFSTECVASTKFPGGAYINTEKWKISYAEWLVENSPTKIEFEMFYGGEDSPCTANVAIQRIKKPHPAEDTFELGFNYRNGKWLLRSTPAWPEGIANRFTEVPGKQEHDLGAL